MIKQLLTYALLFLGVNGAVIAQKVQLEELVSPVDSIVTKRLETLVDSDKPELFPLLNAISESNLYRWKGKWVTLGEKVEGKGKAFLAYTVYPLPAGQSELGPVSLDGLEEVRFSRKQRLKLNPILPKLGLYSPDPIKRSNSYVQLSLRGEKEVLPFLERALKLETSEKAFAKGKEALYAIKLRSAANEEEAKSYLDSLVKYPSGTGLSVINDFQQGQVEGSALFKAAAEQIEALESRQQRVALYQNIFSGISLGSILILIALGLSIIYGLAGVINMAHGEFLMIGAYTTYVVQQLFRETLGMANSDMFFWLSLPLSFLVAGSIGLLVERLVIRHLYHKPLESLLATWGISLVLIQTARSIFGDLTSVSTPEVLKGGWEIIPQLVLPYNRLFIIGVCIAAVLMTYLLLNFSRFGLQVRAVTQNRSMSACLGISTRRVDAATFFLGSGLAGLAGCAMTLIGNVVPDMGQTYIVDSFLVVVTGGVGKLLGTLVSGLGIGSLSKFLEGLYEAVYGKVFILGLIILFLQFRPKGLFPDKGRIGDH